MRSMSKYLFAILLLPTVSLPGCNDSHELIQPRPNATLLAAEMPPGPTVIAALGEAIEREHYAQAKYSRVLTDVG